MIFIITLLLLLLPLAGLWLAQRRLMYLPSVAPIPAAASVLPGGREVRIPTADGLLLHGWWAPLADPGATVVVFNGNAGSRAGRVPLARALGARGYQVLLFDYRGYGGNPGSPSEQGLLEDARAARRFLLETCRVPASELIYLGESLGAAVAVSLATEHPPAAVILRSPFTTMADAAAVHFPFLPVRFLLRDRYPSLDRIGRVRAPILVLAGTADRIVPYRLSRRLYEAAPEPRSFARFDGARHNDPLFHDGEDFIGAIESFLRRHLPRTDPSR